MNIEAVTSTHAWRQVAVHPDERCGGRRQQSIRLDNATGLHVGHQRLPLGIGRRVTAGAGQSGDECRPFDSLGIDAPRGRIVANQFRVGLECGEGFDLRTLTTDGGPGAADRGDEQRQPDQEPRLARCRRDTAVVTVVMRVVFVMHRRCHSCDVRQPSRRAWPAHGPPSVVLKRSFRNALSRVEGRSVGAARRAVKGASPD